ncbi:Sugar phosphate permease [Halopelagius inordinatus]|uniref:Sugar phosphate permease n=1 Tax=Halopelagius inordinatus TaxID=553467 RepID=A0A1I2MA80_9EURY|nr:MFS transporter [Halopelagius inordinatus]SFF88373.1 Sugar phosphate permease [Halopelagius inordinatus]
MGRYRRDDATFVVGVVSVAHFLSHVFLLAYPPLFPLLAAEFDASTAQLGLLVTAIYVPQLLLQLPFGEVVDRIGAKWVLVSGLALTSLSIGGSGFATSYWTLLGFAFASGIGQSVFHPADYALLGAVTTPDNEGIGFSAHTFGGYAGFAAAPLVVGNVGLAVSWNHALVGAGVVGAVVAVGIALTTDSVHARQVAERPGDSASETLRQMVGFVKQSDLLLVFVFYLISMMALVGLQSFTTVLAADAYGFSESTANTLLTVHLACTAVGVVAGGPLADLASFRRVVVGMFVLSAAGVGVLVLGVSSASFAVALAALSLTGFLFGLALPSRDKFANSVADPDAVGKSFGFFFTGLSVGAVVSPTLLGIVIDVWSAPSAFVVVGALLVVAASVVVAATYATAEP